MDMQSDDPANFHLPTVEDYEALIGGEATERILAKAERLQDLHVINVNSTYYGGGVAEILSSLTLLMNGAGIRTGWRVMQGRPDFFSITKKMHNALQGGEINLSELKRDIYEEVVFENAARMHLDHDSSSSMIRSRCRSSGISARRRPGSGAAMSICRIRNLNCGPT